MRVLIGHETSGRTRDAFLRKGHDAISCDLLPTDTPGPHIRDDILNVIADIGHTFDLAIFHPTCTYLCSSGLHWNQNPKSERFGGKQTEEALEHVRLLMQCGIKRFAIENPQGCIGTRIRKADQYIQPYEFGDDASKKTGLWLHNLPLLVKDPAKRVAGRVVEWNGKQVERWANQTDSGQNRLGPSEDRWKVRSQTYLGIAEAFTQWGEI